MSTHPAPLDPPVRVLLGPGPSDVAPSVLRALGKPTLGHLDPEFLRIMDEIGAMLRTVFGTGNELTLPISGTGSSGMETCIVNLVEPGDRVLVAVNGVFGTRMAEVARRCGAQVTEVPGEWGRAMDPDAMRSAADGTYKLVCVVHAETSTGVLQAIPPMRELADELGAMLLVDCVTSLGGHPVELDEWGVDAAYSGTQKCLSCPPGLAPVSFSPRAQESMQARKTPVQSWYLDVGLVRSYWGGERAYHHTAPINMLYGLHEALRLVLEEGLEARHARHARHAEAFLAGANALGLEPAVPAGERLNPLNALTIPEGIPDGDVRAYLLKHYSIEIGGGLGPMKGKLWRVGLMGAGSTRRNVELCLTSLKAALAAHGHRGGGDPLEATRAVYDRS